LKECRLPLSRLDIGAAGFNSIEGFEILKPGDGMSKPKLSIIRPALGYALLPDADFLSRLNAVYAGTFGNPAYPNPPVEAATFRADIDAYAHSIADALDGSKKAKADRDKKRVDLTVMLRLIGHYVEANCKANMTTFLSSGFEAASRTKTPPQPLPQPSIIRVDQGITGQLLVSIKPLPKARTYEVRYAAAGAGGTPGTWATITIPSALQATPVSGLTIGTTYTFQARAFGKLGFSDWSDPVNRMCI
jgi:hypothetical protein